MTRRTFCGLLATLLAAAGAGGGAGYAFLRREMFGALPDAAMFADFESSPNFYGGAFHNISEFPVLRENGSVIMSLLRSVTAKRIDPAPSVPVPAAADAFPLAEKDGDVLVWLGHSSFFMRLGGKTLLLDPVFSAYASPFSFSIRAFEGATPYGASSFPEIDCVLISHDHWDHLDYPTMLQLRGKVRYVLCPLGVGAHLRRWGYDADRIIEKDWGETVVLDKNLHIHVVAARHFSGRTLVRNKALWCGFVLETDKRMLYYSGDGGYDSHFAQIRQEFGKMDFALLDCGQYNEQWPYVHMTPEEADKAAEDLQASCFLPMHIGKFTLAYHPWYEPFERIAAASVGKSYALLTPRIGEKLLLDALPADFVPWWRECL